MARNGFKVFDSDLHVLEPWDLWLRYIAPEYRDRAPIGSTEYMMDLFLIHDGRVISKAGTFDARREGDQVASQAGIHGRTDLYADFDKRGWGPDVQIEAMDAEGIDTAVLFPSRGLFAHAKEYDDDRLAAAVSRAYNNWLVEFCAHAPDRMYGAAMVPVQDVAAAVAEAKRARQELGFKAVFIRPIPMRERNWHDADYDPLWAECERQGLAVAFHEATDAELPVAVADRFAGRAGDPWMTEHVAAHPIEQMYACLSMINGGVCERFPQLRVAFLEGNCSWVPFWLWRMDEHWEASIRDKIRRRPSEYFKRQCFVSIEADESVGEYAIDALNGETIVFSTDFPHRDSAFPNAVKTLLGQPFSDDAKRKILWDNPAKLYDLA